MKKIFTALSILLTVCCQAQLKKGTLNIGFTTTSATDFFFRTKQPGYKDTWLTFYPTVGYQLSSRVEIGGGPSFSYFRDQYTDYPATSDKLTRTEKSYGLNAYAKYYFTTRKKLLPYSIFRLELLRTQLQNEYVSNNYRYTEEKYTNLRFGGGLGLDYRISPKFSLLGEVHVTGNREKDYPVFVSYEFHLGMRYRFPGKRI